MRLTSNFYLHEFECRCGCEMTRDVVENVFELSDELQVLRDLHGAIHINSAYRCKEHNSSIGSKDTSQHVLGKAADITINGISPGEVADAIEESITEGKVMFGGVGRYDTFTHVDIRTNKARWDNTKK